MHMLQFLVAPCQQETDCKNYQRLATLVGNLVDGDEESMAVALSHGLQLKDPSSLSDQDAGAVKIIADIKSDFAL